jgi:hypothetical protein
MRESFGLSTFELTLSHSIGICGRRAYKLVKTDPEAGNAACTDRYYGISESPLLNLPAEIRNEIWRLIIPQYHNPHPKCRGGHDRLSHKQAPNCPAKGDFEVLNINRQMRAEIAPLFGIHQTVFEFCTTACAKRLMDEVACFEGLGVTKASVEMVHITSVMPCRCGTGNVRAMGIVSNGGSHPSFAFQVSFT